MLRLLAWLVFPHKGLSARASNVPKEARQDVSEDERQFNFALLSTAILLFTIYSFMLLFFLYPPTLAEVAFTPYLAEEQLPTPGRKPDPAVTFRLVIGTVAALNCATFVLHHLLQNVTFSAWCFFLYVDGSVWVLCVMYGPVSEFLGALVHVPVLAFFLFGHRAGVCALAITLSQAVMYTGACLAGLVPSMGSTLELGIMAKMSAVMGSYLLLGLSAAVNERCRERAEQMYREAHTRLAKESQAKARFLANMNHELRTPLHGIVAASKELSTLIEATDHVDGQLEMRDMCSIVMESSNYMISLINDVLDFERMESGEMRIERIPFCLDLLCSKVVKMLKPTARAKHTKLLLHFDVAPRFRVGDPLRIRQILFNLISNALKFTPEEGKVLVTVKAGCHPTSSAMQKSRDGEEADRRFALHHTEQNGSATEIGWENRGGEGSINDDLVTIAVRDSGIGILGTSLPLIFTAFSQADISTTRKHGGSGLGLSICKQLCQLMRGRIGCTSKEGKGSTFWVTLPLPPAKDPVHEPATSERADVPARRHREALLSGLRVLLVEDNKVNQTIGRKMLARAGCEVEVAQNGELGVRAWEEKGHFDIVLMDCHMPVMDGFEATRRIRRKEKELETQAHMTERARAQPHTPIIAVSASSDSEEREQGAAAGMDDWLVKPFDQHELEATILQCVRPSITGECDL